MDSNLLLPTLPYVPALVEGLIKEGKRVGKCPWCCSSTHEDAAYDRLNRDSGMVPKYEQETMEETMERRKQEKKEWGCATWAEWRDYDAKIQ